MIHASTQGHNHYDVIVVGAGVIGSALAYELAQQGAKVALVEKNKPASGASGAAGGMLAAHSEHFTCAEMRNFALYSQSLYADLACELREQTGIDIGLRTEGFLLPLTESQTKESENDSEKQLLYTDVLQSDSTISTTTNINSQRTTNINSESNTKRQQWWSASKLAEKEPYIYAPDGMIYNPDEPQLIPTLLNEALVQAAIQLQIDFYPQTEVYRLLHQPNKNQLAGVLTNQCELFTEQVILTTGLATKQLLATEQYVLPFIPVKGELIEVSTPSSWLEHTIYGKGIYIIPKRNRRIWIGATSKPDRTDTRIDSSAIAELLSQAKQYIPEMGAASFERAWSGIRPGTPDELPYLGKIQPISGLWTASGHYRNGILLAAGTAKWMTQAILKNSTAHIPDCFAPERALCSLSYQPRAEGVSIWN